MHVFVEIYKVTCVHQKKINDELSEQRMKEHLICENNFVPVTLDLLQVPLYYIYMTQKIYVINLSDNTTTNFHNNAIVNFFIYSLI